MFCHPTVWCHYSSCSTLTVIFELTLCKMNNYLIVPFINLHIQTYFQFEAVVSRIFLWNDHTKNSLKDFYVFLGFISVAIKYDDLYQWKKTAGGRMAAMISRFAGKTQRRTKTDVFVLLFFCLSLETNALFVSGKQKKLELCFVALITYTGST